ncbi:MAG: 4a-hydroxytetrahydrobiopterin dehydratase [Gammaproteobacteria bacterium]
MTDLIARHCRPCQAGEAPLAKAAALALLKHLNNWEINDTGTEISRIFNFKNYYQTIAFVNALAWIAHQEDHHPTLTVHYSNCEVRYSTHTINGLSKNDFICAAKIDALL